MNENQENNRQLSYLSFRLGNEVFAARLSQILQFLELPEAIPIKPVANAPRYLRGLINFNGKILPVLDLQAKFYIEGDSRSIIILKFIINGTLFEFGSLVDRFDGIVRVPENEIEPIPGIVTGYDISFLSGFFRQKEQLILILDMEKVFTELELCRAVTSAEFKNLKVSAKQY
jgi:purine-binding chemotaxis protein CheW